jgi:hypothetical protein
LKIKHRQRIFAREIPIEGGKTVNTSIWNELTGLLVGKGSKTRMPHILFGDYAKRRKQE